MKNIEKLFTDLNNLSANNTLENKPVRFYYGDTFSRTVEIVCKLIPFGKALLFCALEDYEVKVKPLEKELNERGIKTQILISPKESDLDKVSENVRLVISFGNEFFNLAGKIASLKKMYSLFIVDSFNFDNILSVNFIENGKVVPYNFDRRILFDVDKIVKDESGVANEFAFIMSKILSLVDYRIYGLITGRAIDKTAYGLVKSAVEETYSLFSNSREEYLLTLIKNAVVIRIADALTNGEFIKNSAVDIASSCHKDKKSILSYAKKIAKVYAVTFSNNYEGVSEPNYLERMEKALKYSNASERELSKWIVYQAKLCNDKRAEIALIKELLFNETLNYLNILENVEKTFIALGGSMDRINSELVKVSGDFIDTFNGITLATNSGIGEFI